MTHARLTDERLAVLAGACDESALARNATPQHPAASGGAHPQPRPAADGNRHAHPHADGDPTATATPDAPTRRERIRERVSGA
jgi:hypothetical protein